MTGFDGVTLAEHCVLCEADGDAQLWELAAEWSGSDEDEQRKAAVPVLLAAVTRLAEHGLVKVHRYPSWPPQPDQATPIRVEQLPSLLGNVENWLWCGESTGLITVSLTDDGAHWL